MPKWRSFSVQRHAKGAGMAPRAARAAKLSDAVGGLRVSYMALASLIPFAKNARVHSRYQIAKIKESLESFGWTNPMLVAGDRMIAGHGRLQAAIEMAQEDRPIPGNPDPQAGPTVDLSHLNAVQRQAYIIADNRLALDASWDDEILAEQLGEILAEGFDLATIGFEEDELARLLGGTGPGTGVDPDDAPEPPVHPVSLPQDVWLLGRHRLLCGDATSADDVRKAMAGVSPHLMVTDPPYGVSYDASWRDSVRYSPGRARGKVKNDDCSDWRVAWALFPGDVVYIWHGERQVVEMGEQLDACGFERRNLIVWMKDKHSFGRGHYHSRHETCWYAVRKNATAHWAGDRTQTTVWEIDRKSHITNETGHSTRKPVECMQRPLENNSSPGQAVYDPFVGSGTTLVAAEMTGRTAICIEIDPSYVDVCVKRWEQLTDKVAVLESTGQTFADVSMQRIIPKEADAAE